MLNDDDEDTCHITCPFTDDWAKCGQHVGNEDWLGDGQAKVCETCEEFEDAEICGHCLMGGTI